MLENDRRIERVCTLAVLHVHLWQSPRPTRLSAHKSNCSVIVVSAFGTNELLSCVALGDEH